MNCLCKEILANGGLCRKHIVCPLYISRLPEPLSPWAPFSRWTSLTGYLGVGDTWGRRWQEMKIATFSQGLICSESMLKLLVDLPRGRSRKPSTPGWVCDPCGLFCFLKQDPGTGSTPTESKLQATFFKPTGTPLSIIKDCFLLVPSLWLCCCHGDTDDH